MGCACSACGCICACCQYSQIPEQELPKTSSHYVYIMTNEFYPRDYVKIGRTINMQRRVDELNSQMLSNHTLPIYYKEVKDDKVLEKYLHQMFAEQRISKHREWFKVNPHLVIKAIQDYPLE